MGGLREGEKVFGRKFKRAWVAIAALALVLTSAAPGFAQRRQGPPGRGQAQSGRHAGQWLRQYRNLPPEQQRRALQSDPAFRRLPPQRQQQLEQRLQHFSSRPPEEQQRILNRMETWEHLTPEQKNQARQVFTQMRNLPPQRRQAVRNAIQALRGMPPGAREREINSERFKAEFSPEERGILSGASKLPLAPAENPDE